MSTTSSDVVVSVEKLHLVFNASVHRSWSWREAFVRAAKDPIGAVFPEKDRLHVLRGIDLQVRSGDRVALIGVNGTGKTSLCRCIAGIYQPTSGTIRVKGLVRAIFDTAVGIHPELTGRENARLLARFIYPFDVDRHEEMVEEALEFSELGKFVDVPYKLYSNGMQARLCLSMVSCKPGDLLILDEVFDGADVFFREKISKRITSMIDRSGAVIFVSHSPDQIEKVCNRLVLIGNGGIVFDGEVREGLRIYQERSR